MKILYGEQGVLWPDLIKPYLRNNQGRICPSDAQAKIVSYGLNELGIENDLKPDHPDACTLPALDGPHGSPISGVLVDTANARPSARYFGRANTAFMDGHVEALWLEQFYSVQMPPDK
ncbi:hypothetical protein [Capsulimonas corticalis]|uniref:hypothetical protein n=1 Tax=Capsulimonas corticalis TaxID=2219043 RepID=UPI0014042539|nr:hypothetical protein [Capsulimonas corticalis]